MTDIVERLTRGDIRQAGRDLIARCFGNKSVAIASIPARPDVDADLVLMGGLTKAAEEIERLRAIPGLSDVIDGKAVIVPRDPSAEQVDGLASRIRGAGFSGDSYMLARVCFDFACRASPYRKERAHD